MKHYKSLKEWGSDAFKQAREKGLLDSPESNTKTIPDDIQKYLKISGINFDGLQAYIYKNKIETTYDRIIIYNNNFYTTTQYTHNDMLVYLAIFEGFPLGRIGNLASWKTIFENFVALMLDHGHGHLYFSDSYSDIQINKMKDLINKNKDNFKNIINDIEKRTRTKFTPIKI